MAGRHWRSFGLVRAIQTGGGQLSILPQQSEVPPVESPVHIEATINFEKSAGAYIAIAAVSQPFGQSYRRFRPALGLKRSQACSSALNTSRGAMTMKVSSMSARAKAMTLSPCLPDALSGRYFPPAKQCRRLLANTQQGSDDMLFQPAACQSSSAAQACFLFSVSRCCSISKSGSRRLSGSTRLRSRPSLPW